MGINYFQSHNWIVCLFVCLNKGLWLECNRPPIYTIFHSAKLRNWIFTLQQFHKIFQWFLTSTKQRLKNFIKCDFRMVLTTFFFAFLHTIKLPQYIWKGNLLLLKCIPSFSHERRILGPLLECRLRMACGLTSYSKVYD